MYENKLRCAPLWALMLILSTDAAAESSPVPAAEVPRIARVDQRFLTDLVRRTIAARLANAEPYRPSYLPPALADIECQVVVTLRQAGYTRGVGTSNRRPVIEAAQEAAIVALSSARSGQRDDLVSLQGIRIEMQALGGLVDFPGNDRWTAPGALDGFVEPGVHGVRLFLDGEGRWFTPGEMISRGLAFDDALKILGKEISLDSRVLHESKMSKFRTLHWWEIDDAGKVVTLCRGMVRLPPDEVSAHRIDEAIATLAEYMAFRQRGDGAFTCTYDPTLDLYATEDDAVMQAGATWALAEHARGSRGTRKTREAVERAMAVIRKRTVALPSVENGAFVASPDFNNRTAITAEACLALCAVDAPDAIAQRTRLVNGLLWLQRPDGRFLSVFPPTVDPDTPERAGGQTLLALARSHEQRPRSEVIDAIGRAFEYYRGYFKETGSPAMVPWHTQAFAIAARLTKRRDFADFVFEMSDQVCAHQLTADNCPWPELWGAIETRGMGPSAGTAAFVEGLAEAALLARQVGDRERFSKYRDACRSGVRFILQLQFKPDECYYVRTPRDAIGGIRSSPTHVRIHLDSCQHALLALTKTRALPGDDQP